MANPETKCKVSLVGVWREVVLTDELAKNIAARATAEKGKRILIVLRKEGLTLIRTKLFKDNRTEFYSIGSLGRVERNSRNTQCVMIETRDKTNSKIIAVRCNSEADAIHLVSLHKTLHQDSHFPPNVELKKNNSTRKGTLTERSVVNANRHMAEIFKENQDSGTPTANGGIHHVPILDKSNYSNSNNIYSEVQVVEAAHAGENGGITMKEDNGDIIQNHDGTITTTMVEDTNVSPNYIRHEKSSSPIIYATSRTVLPSRPVMMSQPNSRRASQLSYTSARGPIVYRVSEKHKADRVFVADPWASHRRFSGDFALQRKVDQRYYSNDPDSGETSQRVTFDNESIASTSSQQRPVSLRARPRPVITSVSTTVPRSIEATYGRRGSGNAHLLGRKRPASIHVLRGNDLQVYQTSRHDDVLL